MPVSVKYLLFFIIYILSLAPLPLLYLLANLISILLEYVFKYRKSVILRNLQSSFPEFDRKKIHHICHHYYRNFGEVMVETIKLMSISKIKLKKMVKMHETESLKQFLSEKQNVMLYFAHRGNFEIGSQFLPFFMNKKLYGAYKPFKTDWVEWLWFKTRTRFNTVPVPVKNIVKTIFENAGKGIVYGFLNDQSPTLGDQHLWVKFLEKDTIFFTGPEKIARKYNNPVYFADLKRIGKGKYLGSIELLSSHPKELSPNELTYMYVRKLENAIHEQPDNWLWSHNRWKHHKIEEC